LIHDKERGVYTDHVVDPDGTMRWETWQDPTPILEANKRRQRETSMLGNTQRHAVRVAEIPQLVMRLWKEELGDPSFGDPEVERRWKKRLNDPEWRWLRVDTRHL
jgi:hypothetical protein